MIFIVVKFTVKPEVREEFPSLVRAFTEATRAEAGNLWFEWSRSLDRPEEYVLVEAFRDGAAGVDHVGSDHFKRATAELPALLAKTPEIVNVEVPGTGWSEMGELSVPPTG